MQEERARGRARASKEQVGRVVFSLRLMEERIALGRRYEPCGGFNAVMRELCTDDAWIPRGSSNYRFAGLYPHRRLR